MALIELPDQPLAERMLTAMLSRENLPRQLLLWGPAGLGKREAARRIAWELIDPGVEHGPGGQSLDLTWVAAAGEVLRLEEVDPALADLATGPQVGRRRVVVIESPERLREQDGRDRLLKSLEEPGVRSTLILVTDNLDAVAGTIRSRCLPVPFRHPGTTRLVKLLTERGLDPERAEVVAQTTGTAALAGGPAEWELAALGARFGAAITGEGDGHAVVRDIEGAIEAVVRENPSDEQARLAAEARDKEGKRGGKTAAKKAEDQMKRELRRFRSDGWRRTADAAASAVARSSVTPERRARLLLLLDQARADLALNPEFSLWVDGLLARAEQIRCGEEPSLLGAGRLP